MPQPALRLIPNAWIEIRDGYIHRLSSEAEPLPEEARRAECFDAGGALATPGLVDCHTHPVFKGTRQAEFVRRCRGETYLQIAAAGGGIKSSMRGVREASEKELARLIRARLDRFAALGVTMIEAKSGYGLSFEAELKSLRALRKAAEGHPVEVSPTLLAAHVVPPEFQGRADDYVEMIVQELIP
ncbi:MAG: imidazolonepropionase, partial [Calditrichota bacterium]